MDRRRIVPAPEGLEGRALLSLFGQTHPTWSNNPAQDVPQTIRQKELRIAHLPYYIDKLQPGRFLPKDTIEGIQTDLNALVAGLHPAPTKALDNFNHLLRNILPRASLSPGDAHGLNRAFGAVLEKAGATPQEVSNLRSDMTDLARVDANSPNPVFLATNDYSLVLETALGVGRPIVTPSRPMLALRDGTRTATSGVTTNHQPTLVGTYEAGATIDAGTMMQIVDGDGKVLGVGSVQSNGKYAVTIEQPLNDGTYTLHARSEIEGHLSKPGPGYLLKVVSRPRDQEVISLVPPGGPLGLK